MTRPALPAIAVGAAVVAVALASLAAWRQVSAPETTAASAQRPEVWARAWAEARGCVLGATPSSNDPIEAIATADLLAPDRTCGRQLVALGRAAGPDEAELHALIGDVADAFAAHQRRLLAGKRDDPDPLPRAMDALDLAATRLHPTARPPAAASPTLQALSPKPILLDGDPASANVGWRTIYARRSTNEQLYEIRWANGAPAPLPYPVDGSDATWAPSGMWQVWTDDVGRTTKLSSATDQAEDITLITSTKPGVRLVAALGEGDNRLVIFHDYEDAWVARSTDGARHWSRQKLPVHGSLTSSAVSLAGTAIDLTWIDGGTRWMRLEPELHARGPLPTPTTVSDGAVYTDCTVGALWLILPEGDEWVLRRPELPGSTARFKEEPFIQACSADHAAILVDGRQWACDTLACRLLPELTGSTWVGVVDGEVVRVAEQDDVLAIWRGDREPVFARLPHGRETYAIVDGGGRAAVALMGHDDRLEYVELPR